MTRYYICINIYIYIHTQRERDRDVYKACAMIYSAKHEHHQTRYKRGT